MLKRLAPAKINLTLQVTGKRPDGYHLLDSIVVFSDIGDEVSAQPSTRISLTISGPFADDLGLSDDNLVLRAAHLLQQKCGVRAGAALQLEKNLPVASGIGGGSADAAATLNFLNEFWQLDLSIDDLQAMGLQLGADIPVCLLSRTALMQGIGEQVTPLPINAEFALVLVNPGLEISTPAIFKALDLTNCAPQMTDAMSLSKNNFVNAIEKGANDLQPVAVKIAPVIKTVLDRIALDPACRFARMSGSGATCFGMFDNLDDAINAAAVISARNPQWWTKATLIR